MKIKEVALSEYKSVFIAEDGTAWAHGWVNGVGAKVIQYKGGYKFVSVIGGLYNTLLLKDNGDVYVNNPNNQDLTFLQYDNTGTQFKAISIETKLSKYYAVRNDGTIWMQNSISLPWTKVSTPLNVKFKSIVKGVHLVALSTDGIVYTLADGSTNWTKKELPGPVSKILANANGVYIAIVNGFPIGWGQLRYLTGITGIITTYKELSFDWNIAAPIIDIAINDNTIHYIDSTGKLWGMGDNIQGEVGVGWELVNRKELYKGTWYIYNWINAIQPSYQSIAFVPKPVHISQEKTFARIFGGGTYSYYKFAIDIDGNLYSWGRNKAAVLANGIAISNESLYPNALDVLKPTKVDPFAYTIPLFDGSLYEFIPGRVMAGQDLQIETDTITLIGSTIPSRSKTFKYEIVSYEWRKLSGPDCSIENRNDGSAIVKGMTNGIYAFELKATDNNGATMTDSLSVTVLRINDSPTVTTYCNELVIDNWTFLAGEVLDNDGNIQKVLWEKVSGPDGDVILNPSNIISKVSFTNSGEYVYKLTATDNEGASASSEILLNVWDLGNGTFMIINKK